MTFDRPVYVDANVFIYAAETDTEEGRLARRWLIQVDRGRIAAITSEFTGLEIIPTPLASKQVKLVEGYRRLLAGDLGIRVVPVTSTIVQQAIVLRADHRCSTPDAIHVATAMVEGCGSILTNDERLQMPPSLQRLTLADVAVFYR